MMLLQKQAKKKKKSQAPANAMADWLLPLKSCEHRCNRQYGGIESNTPRNQEKAALMKQGISITTNVGQ